MRWLVIPAVVVGMLASPRGAGAEEPRSRTITLECMAPPSAPARDAPVLVRCRTKGTEVNARIVVAFIDLFTPPYWHTMDPFATASHVASAKSVWRSRLADSVQTSAAELRDPFAPSDGELSDEP